ncbi:MAG: ABC transporter substrate-binding protein, partial [Elusimicrobia bacterium]|nr:ABC transporter substrate-binding protein [Elusimicrobiota bacterium]
MKLFRIALVLLLGGALGVAAASRDATVAQAQAQTIKVGVLYDLTGPFAAAGAVPGSIGTKIAVDMVNEKGGVLGKYKIQPVAGDSQSKPDVAINEA